MINSNSKYRSLIVDRHFRFLSGLSVSFTIFFSCRGLFEGIDLLILSWVSFVFVYLLFSWIVISTFHPIEVKKLAKKEDSTGTFIFLFVLGAAVCSLAGIFLLLKTIPKGHNGFLNPKQILSFASVFASWILVHTIFTLRYAHLYYKTDEDNKENETSISYGLDFPGDQGPDYLDFAYFSFVLGMTFQVSDVQITSKCIRRLALLHGCLSFLYNTIIVALSVNIISGIVSGK